MGGHGGSCCRPAWTLEELGWLPFIPRLELLLLRHYHLWDCIGVNWKELKVGRCS